MTNLRDRALSFLDRRVGLPLFPRDRLLSAISDDGVRWRREAGVRLGEQDGQEMIYHNCLAPWAAGGWRMFYHASAPTPDGWRGRIFSAVSRDGLRWQREAGVRVDCGGARDAQHARSPFVVATGDAWRMFYTGFGADGVGQLLSAVSGDGLIWRKEAGVRLTPTEMGGSISDVCVVAIEAGWRAYGTVVQSDGSELIRSAVSEDGIAWRVEAGARLAPTGSPLAVVVNNPCVVRLDDGRWRLYFRGGDRPALNNMIFSAISTDGLAWGVEGLRLDCRGRHERHGVAFPHVVRRRDGRWRMYYTGYWGKHWQERQTVAQWMR